MEHYLTFTESDSEGHKLLLHHRFNQKVDFYEVEHEHTGEGTNGDPVYTGWVTQYFRTSEVILKKEQTELSNLPNVLDSKFNQPTGYTEEMMLVLEAFLQSEDFTKGVTSATKASWGGSGYSVELFEDGHWRVLWNNEIGNLYRSPGLILGLPKWDDSDYQECVNSNDPERKQTEEEYFGDCALYQEDDAAQEMRDDLHDRSIQFGW